MTLPMPSLAYRAVAALDGRGEALHCTTPWFVEIKCYNAEEVLEVAEGIPNTHIERVCFSWYTWGISDNVKDYLYRRIERARAERC